MSSIPTRRNVCAAGAALPAFSLVGAHAQVGASARARDDAASDRYRPQVHFSPPSGFMNDPNGLLHYDGEWHLFYQYNPTETRAGHVHWGHAISSDLLRWRDLPVALGETAAGQAFSGSAVWDRGDTSGLFGSSQGGMALAYTRAAPDRQSQELAISRDGGRTFTGYAGNPVLDRASASFRDPKVFRHAASGRWIMVCVASGDHRVLFYASGDLKRWEEVGGFGYAGVLGVDYECPDLVELPVEGGGARWVLFLSINPGAPQGGSAVQYFVGAFDGRTFTPEDRATRFADFGKDFYALQTWNDAPGGEAVGIAWMSNWQYCNDLPQGRWRGVMSLPRRFSLRRSADDWRLVQSFRGLETAKRRPLAAPTPKPGEAAHVALPPGAAIEVKVRLDVGPGAVASLAFANGGGEALEIGFDHDAAQVFVDRGALRGFRHRFFTDKFSDACTPGGRKIDLHLVFDRCTLEGLQFGGESSVSLLHFFEHPADVLRVSGAGDWALKTFEVAARSR